MEDHRGRGSGKGSTMTLGQKLERAWQASVTTSLGDLFWYGLLACAVWLFFDVAFRKAFQQRRISRRKPMPRQIGREIVHSLRSIAVFGLVTGLVTCAALSG